MVGRRKKDGKKTFGSNIKLDWGDKPLDPIINSSRIVICSYVGTTYLETLQKHSNYCIRKL